MARQWLVGGWLLLAGVALGQAPGTVDFKRDVVPILRVYCLGCHQSTDRNGNLSMQTFAEMLEGGEHGPAWVAGKSGESRLFLMTAGQLEPKMPPEGNPAPSLAEIETLRRWIDEGGMGPADPQEAMVADPVVPSVSPKGKPPARVQAAAWSPDGRRVALAGYRQVQLVDPTTGYIEATFGGLAGVVTDVSFSNDGAWLISVGGVPGVRGEAVLWKLADGSRERVFAGHSDGLFAARLSADRSTLVTAGYDKSILVWNVGSGAIERELKGHNEAIHSLAYRPGSAEASATLASVSSDRTVKLWNHATGDRLDTFSESLKDLLALTFSSDGAFLLAGGGDNRIRVWSISSSAKEGTNSLVESRFAHEGMVLRLAMSPSGRQVASAGTDLQVKLWQWPGLREERVLEKQPDWPSAILYSPDGMDLLVARQEGSVAIYDPSTGQKRRDLIPTPKPPPPPTIVRLRPIPVTIGQPSRVQVLGTNLSGVQQLKFSHGGLSGAVLAEPAPRPEEITLEVSATGETPIGRYELRLVTAGGETAPVAVDVDTLAHVEEVEAGTAGSAPTVTLPLHIWGTLDSPGDTDEFAFEAEAGQELVLDVAGKRLGGDLNSVVEVVDSAGRSLATNNDYLEEPDSFLIWKAPAAGRYRARVRDLAFAGSAKHFYRLTLGAIPYVTGVHPLGVPVGRESKVELTGPNVPAGSAVPLMPTQAGDVAVPFDPKGMRTRHRLVVVATRESVAEQEPNDLPSQGTPLPVPGEAAGRFDRPGDEDHFAMSLRQGERVILETDAVRRGFDVDTRIDVLSAEGQPIERTWLVAVRDSYVEFRGIDSSQLEIRCKSWQEMELNQFMYMNGEVGKLFRHPRGPDSGFLFYSVAGQRRTYFDTTSASHALEDPVYIVEPVAPGTNLIPSGLPIFPIHYSNDDASDRRLRGDSQLTFTAPADGVYVVRVVEVRGLGSNDRPYRLLARRPAPDFFVSMDDRRPTIFQGSGREVVFRVDRRDGFDGPIDVEVTDLPAGFTISQPIRIEPDHEVASGVLLAAGDALAAPAEAWAKVKVTARAKLGEETVAKPVASWEQIGLSGAPPVRVRIEPAEIVLTPGGTISAKVVIERASHQDLVTFEMPGLPHGVIVDNIGLNGILIPAGETEREFFLNARPFVEPTDRPFFARSNEVGAQASPPVLLSIRPASQVATGSTP